MLGSETGSAFDFGRRELRRLGGLREPACAVDRFGDVPVSRAGVADGLR
ncbi:MAG: hypothetical protein ACOX6D_00835 [Thermoguttaceae bacterium]